MYSWWDRYSPFASWSMCFLNVCFIENTNLTGHLVAEQHSLRLSILTHLSGADPGFKVRGAHLKKLRRADGGAKIVGVFRVKNHDFTPKNDIFSNFRGGRAPGAPHSGSAPAYYKCKINMCTSQPFSVLHYASRETIQLVKLRLIPCSFTES